VTMKIDCRSAFPSVVDGLIPNQREILCSVFQLNLKQEVRVSHLVNCSELKQMLTFCMAHDFVGSNNLNLVRGRGLLGTRHNGGGDRYDSDIAVWVSRLARAVFPLADDVVLHYLDDTAPQYFVPVIPMCLVNGGYGIELGYGHHVPSFNPRDIVENLMRMLNGLKPYEMIPWYKGYRGRIVVDGRKRFISKSVWRRLDDQTLEITELPVGKWTWSYRSHLERISFPKTKTEKKCKDGCYVTEYIDNCTETNVHLIVRVPILAELTDEEIENIFDLNEEIPACNFYLLDINGKVNKFQKVDDILRAFFYFRLKYYQKRKDYLVINLTKQKKKLQKKVQFITELISTNTEQGKNFMNFSRISCEYVEDINFWDLTQENIEALNGQLEKTTQLLEDLYNRTPKDLWEEELDMFIELWDIYENKIDENLSKKDLRKYLNNRVIERASLRKMFVEQLALAEEIKYPTNTEKESNSDFGDSNFGPRRSKRHLESDDASTDSESTDKT